MNTRPARDSSRIRFQVGAKLIRLVAVPLAFLALLVFVPAKPVFAGTKTFTGTGNFSDATKWGGTLPAAGQTLQINGVCTFDNAAANLTYGNLTLGSGSTTGSIVWPVGGTNTLDVNAVSSNVAGSAIDMTNGGTFKVETSWSLTNITFTPGAGTIAWNVTGANSTLPASISTYNNLTIDTSTQTATLGAATTVNSTLTISSGTLSVGASNFALNVGGNWTNNGETFSAGRRAHCLCALRAHIGSSLGRLPSRDRPRATGCFS